MGSGLIYGLCSLRARKVPPSRREIYPDENREIRWGPPDWLEGPPANLQDLSHLLPGMGRGIRSIWRRDQGTEVPFEQDSFAGDGNRPVGPSRFSK
jgi:hypothetical protein